MDAVPRHVARSIALSGVSLVLDNLTKRFGPVTALDGISFEVKPGEVFGFLGGNGAGKTTTMRIILDILRADAGSVTWNGQPTDEAPRATWGYLPEERGLYPRMEVLEQLVFIGDLFKVPRKEGARRAREWLERFRIADYAKRRAEELSKGNQQKIQFIAAVLHEPPVLLMDEPFVGLDPVNVALLKEAFLEMRDRGATIVFSTHQMEMVEELCETVVLIDRGRVVLGGSVREVRALDRPAGHPPGGRRRHGAALARRRARAFAWSGRARTTPSSTSSSRSIPRRSCARRSIGASA